MSECNPGESITNVAGIARDDNTKFSANGKPDSQSAEDISKHMLRSETSQWADTFETNVTAHYFMSAAFIPLLAKGSANSEYTAMSTITNISSISGLVSILLVSAHGPKQKARSCTLNSSVLTSTNLDSDERLKQRPIRIRIKQGRNGTSDKDARHDSGRRKDQSQPNCTRSIPIGDDDQ